VELVQVNELQSLRRARISKVPRVTHGNAVCYRVPAHLSGFRLTQSSGLPDPNESERQPRGHVRPDL
jgi:hypothetical protein